MGEHFKLELWLSVGNFFYSEKGGYIRVNSGISTENRNSEIYLFIFFCKFSGGWIKHHHFWFKYTALGICVSLIIKTNECIYKFKQRFLIAFRDKIKTFKLDKKQDMIKLQTTSKSSVRFFFFSFCFRFRFLSLKNGNFIQSSQKQISPTRE